MTASQKHALDTLQKRLVRLGRLRRGARWISGISLLLTGVLLCLATILAADVSFHLDVPQRLTLLLLALGTLSWFCLKYVRPHFGCRETAVDLALVLEDRHGIDSDLVAALEFAQPDAEPWGSATLRRQVITDVADREPDLELARGVECAAPLKRLIIAFGAVCLAGGLVLTFPQHIAVFLGRLTLGTAHYPSRTAIASILINDQPVYGSSDLLTPITARCTEGHPLTFRVRCARAAPRVGHVTLTPRHGQATRRVTLIPNPAPAASRHGEEVEFTAELSQLLDSVTYQIYLGDAWTNPASIEMVPLPQVEIRLAVTPPAYTGEAKTRLEDSGTTRVTVLEGSSINMQVVCTNTKPLRAVSLQLESGSQSSQYELAPQDGSHTQWQLDANRCPSLQQLRENVRFAIHATDRDGLRPAMPVTGELRVQSDLPPAAAIATIHRVLLPTARPTIAFQVRDDYGISRLQWQLTIDRSNQVDPFAVPGGTLAPDRTDLRPPYQPSPPHHQNASPPEIHWLEPPDFTSPIVRTQLPYQGEFALTLESYQLQKGDRINVSLQATDFRGTSPGVSVMSKPLYLEVSDEAGVLNAILEADRQTASDLDRMIQQQLGLEE